MILFTMMNFTQDQELKLESQRNYEKLRNFFNLKKQNLLDGIN